MKMLFLLVWVNVCLLASGRPHAPYTKPTSVFHQRLLESSKYPDFEVPQQHIIGGFTPTSGAYPSTNFERPNVDRPYVTYEEYPPRLAPSAQPPQESEVVHKHITVHVPPEVDKPKYPPAPPKKPEKHYRIVFIRAPSEPAQPPVTPDPPKEEKTLIYVLVKKPEEAQKYQTPPPPVTSKPEVYFVQYKPVLEKGTDPGSYGGGYHVQEDVHGGQEYYSQVSYVR